MKCNEYNWYSVLCQTCDYPNNITCCKEYAKPPAAECRRKEKLMKYKKKPIIIEAFKYDGDLKGSDGEYYVPDWAVKAFEEGSMRYGAIKLDEQPSELFIDTLEGTHHVSVGDYVIQGVQGELYPCKSDIFEKTYETVN